MEEMKGSPVPVRKPTGIERAQAAFGDCSDKTFQGHIVRLVSRPGQAQVTGNKHIPF